MFNKLLIKALKKRFKKFSPYEKQIVREMVNNETISDTTEKKKKVKKRSKKIMADVEEVKKVDTEVKTEEKTNDVDKDKSTETVETKESKVDETKKDETTEPTNEQTEQQNPTEPKVESVEPTGNGVRVEDIVTKDMLAERLSAFEAKFEAVVKENNDLKNKLSTMEDKYENKDFGNFNKQGMLPKDKEANSSFDEYSKQFMS